MRASRTARVEACHLRRDAAFIEEDQPVQVDPANHFDELFAPLAVLVRVTLLGGRGRDTSCLIPPAQIRTGAL